MSDNPPRVVLFNSPMMLDRVFFRKQDVHLGTEFAYHGRTDPGSKWRVEAIYHFYKTTSGSLRRKRVDTVQTLYDEIWLRRIGQNGKDQPLGNEFRPTFAYISYSALWRII